MPRELDPCGTWGAYQAHRRNNEPIDPECQEACRRRSAEYRAANLEAVRANDRARKRRSRALKRQETSE
jgi:hypothetical protein